LIIASEYEYEYHFIEYEYEYEYEIVGGNRTISLNTSAKAEFGDETTLPIEFLLEKSATSTMDCRKLAVFRQFSGSELE
jgi:hypothetical protein